jgi:organic radical activating enzyme
MTLFGQPLLQNDVFKLLENFSDLGIRAFLENGLGSFQKISYFTDLRQTRVAKNIPKTVLQTRDSKPKKPRILWFSLNILWSLSEATL